MAAWVQFYGGGEHCVGGFYPHRPPLLLPETAEECLCERCGQLLRQRPDSCPRCEGKPWRFDDVCSRCVEDLEAG